LTTMVRKAMSRISLISPIGKRFGDDGKLAPA
jgi:hypothetical protein